MVIYPDLSDRAHGLRKMTRFAALLACLLGLEAVAWADISPNDLSISTFDPENAVAPIATVEGSGVKVGDGTIIHPVFGLETGYVSNVFYTDTNPQGAGLLRLLAQVGAGSLTADRLLPASPDDTTPIEPSFDYRASLRASYDMLVLGNDTIASTGGLGLGAQFRGLINPAGRWSFGFNEDFTRIIRAANFETDANTNRDINGFGLNLLYHPQGAAFSGYAYYVNTIDVFERNSQSFADRFQNQLGLHPQWRWLPETQLYADISGGIFTGLGTSVKQSSIPFIGILGIQTLLTLHTTFSAYGGYDYSSYSAGPSVSSPVMGMNLGYRYSPLGRIALTYDWSFTDSINANYYRDHTIRLWWQQMLQPVILMVQPEVHFREYDGVSTIVMGAPDTRSDVIFSVVAGVHVTFRNWIAATLDYHFTDVSTNYVYPTTGVGGTMQTNPGFVRHELLLGMRVAM